MEKNIVVSFVVSDLLRILKDFQCLLPVVVKVSLSIHISAGIKLRSKACFY